MLMAIQKELKVCWSEINHIKKLLCPYTIIVLQVKTLSYE